MTEHTKGNPLTEDDIGGMDISLESHWYDDGGNTYPKVFVRVNGRLVTKEEFTESVYGVESMDLRESVVVEGELRELVEQWRADADERLHPGEKALIREKADELEALINNE